MGWSDWWAPWQSRTGMQKVNFTMSLLLHSKRLKRKCLATSFELADTGRNSKVEVELGKSKYLVAMTDFPGSVGSLYLRSPILTVSVKVTIKAVHSSKNNGFEQIQVWTTGKVLFDLQSNPHESHHTQYLLLRWTIQANRAFFRCTWDSIWLEQGKVLCQLSLGALGMWECHMEQQTPGLGNCNSTIWGSWELVESGPIWEHDVLGVKGVCPQQTIPWSW